MVTLLAMVVGVIVALQQVAKSGFGALPAAALIVSAVSFLFTAVLRAQSTRRRCWISRCLKFVCSPPAVLSHFFVSLSHTSTFFLLPFYLQGILHFTPTQVGLTIIFFSLVIVFLAPVGGWLADRLGSRMLCTVGSVLTVLSMVGFARLRRRQRTSSP